jgi:uncharacterized cupin superfamily protein
MKPFQIVDTFAALDDAGGARPLPVTPDFWEALMNGRLGTFSRLVSCFSFDKNWDSWERHPAGEELVCMIDGDVELVLDKEEKIDRVVLSNPGDYVLVPRGVWHTAKVRRPSKMLFITPGEGTENRPA